MSTENENENTMQAKQRTVLSFVRRSGRLDARLQHAQERYASQYLLDVTEAPGSFRLRENLNITHDWISDKWGNDNPLIVEIGSGQGENIVAAAERLPETNFLALEVYDPGVAHTMLLAGKQGLTNLRIAQINAPDFFAACDCGVLEEVWTFFPDPWYKCATISVVLCSQSLSLQYTRHCVEGVRGALLQILRITLCMCMRLWILAKILQILAN